LPLSQYFLSLRYKPLFLSREPLSIQTLYCPLSYILQAWLSSPTCWQYHLICPQHCLLPLFNSQLSNSVNRITCLQSSLTNWFAQFLCSCITPSQLPQLYISPPKLHIRKLTPFSLVPIFSFLSSPPVLFSCCLSYCCVFF
jgi:hypothetical protein